MNAPNFVAGHNYDDVIPSKFEGLLDVFDRHMDPTGL